MEISIISAGTSVIGDYSISYNHAIEPINMLALGLVLIAMSKFGGNKFRRTSRFKAFLQKIVSDNFPHKAFFR
jgi:O-antigen/teichoic acid export membrane protein